MAVIKIRKAQREGARLVIGIAGISGSGKTYSALQLAFGLANFDASKVGFIDTENKRGSLYADTLKNAAGDVQEFYIGDLEPPFSPQRYSDSIKEFQAAGVEVLVIDSISHEHEGTGGLLEMREPLPGKSGKRDNYAKAEHKKMMNTLLQSNMHVIVCVRAREKVTIEKVGNETKYIQQGVQPICEKNFMFEMTASLMMWDEGKMQQVLKCPSALKEILGREQDYITAADGLALRAWVDGAKRLDPAVEAARSELKMACGQGTAELLKAWKKTPAAIKEAINGKAGCPDEYKLAAQEFDNLQKPQEDPELADINSEILGEQAA
jgi:hypothetical protein